MLTLDDIKTVSFIIKSDAGRVRSRNYETPEGGLDTYNSLCAEAPEFLEQGQYAEVLGLGYEGGRTQVIARSAVFFR
jgi:hypothetical protein